MILPQELDQIEKLKKKISIDPDIIGLIQFGSSLCNSEYNDIDLCIITHGHSISPEKKLKYRTFLPEHYEVQFFEDLPLYIKHEVLKKGKKLLLTNEERMYEIAVYHLNFLKISVQYY